jgi:hypothetical protein
MSAREYLFQDFLELVDHKPYAMGPYTHEGCPTCDSFLVFLSGEPNVEIYGVLVNTYTQDIIDVFVR